MNLKETHYFILLFLFRLELCIPGHLRADSGQSERARNELS